MSETTSVYGVNRPAAHWRTIMLVVVAVLGVIVLGALIITVGGTNRERDRALALQSHSYEVMILARTLSSTIARAESSLGRYVISGDRDLGQLYMERWALAGHQIDQLGDATADSAGQQQRIEDLRDAYQTRGRELSLTALSIDSGQNDQALAHYYEVRNARSLTEINMVLDAIIDRERSLLSARSETAAQSVATANLVVKILSAFGILIAIAALVLGWLTVKALNERADARADADTERLRAGELEDAVAEATAELKQQAIERAETEAKLRQVQKMEAVGQLTGGIAHDFNNMLAVVLGGLELAKRNLAADPGQAQRHIDNAVEGANRAAALTRRLLAFSRAEALRPEPIDVAHLIAGMSDLLDRTLGGTITIAVEDEGCGWRIWADRLQLENALLNLAVNARDAMEGKGMLTIRTGGTSLARDAIGECAAGDYATIAVTDSGCGMSAAVLERVFEPFFTTKPVGKGTGLGLSQIFGFARQSDGEVTIASAPDKGTTVTLYLPRHREAMTGKVSPAPTATVTTETPPQALRVLVVEDDPRVLAATMGALEELGHDPVACDDPGDAAALLERHDPVDLIVSDVMMPRITGPEMIAGLGKRHAHVAVLFVTGYTGEAAGDFGGHAVLRKPFTLAALDRAIAEVMASDRPPAMGRIAAE